MTVCPTKAIRVKNGKAHIIDERCIDCGECLRFCPYNAILSITTSFADLKAFKYKVAILSPVLYGQFDNRSSPNEILFAVRRTGFDYVYEIGSICELNNTAIDEYLVEHPDSHPRISSTCSVVVRLIQRLFPSLCELIIPIEPPREIAAKILRAGLARALKLKPEDIGIFHITPCAAKLVSINHPASMEKSNLDGAISIRDIYQPTINALRQTEEEVIIHRFFPETVFSGVGLGWSLSGGETRGLRNHRTVAVSGVRDTIRVLDEVETGKLKDIDYLECMVCPDGCVGGPLAVGNRFLAKSRILRLVNAFGEKSMFDQSEINRLYRRNYLAFQHSIKPTPLPPLDSDPAKAVQKAKRREELLRVLPAIDCGACGAPDCRTLADDIVRGLAAI
jgi:iron only hydrogenase large subunit-like protein